MLLVEGFRDEQNRFRPTGVFLGSGTGSLNSKQLLSGVKQSKSSRLLSLKNFGKKSAKIAHAKSKMVAQRAIEQKRKRDEAIKAQREKLQQNIDEILDQQVNADVKYRRLQQFAVRNNKKLARDDRHIINLRLKELDKQRQGKDEKAQELKKDAEIVKEDKKIEASSPAFPSTANENDPFVPLDTPTTDEKAINKLAENIKTNQAKSKVSTNLSAEIIARKGI